jgi:hypothetical protein
MAVDVMAPGDNVIAKVQALIEKSAIMVVDITSLNTIYEAGLALADDRFSHRLIIVASESMSIPTRLRALPIVIRPTSFDDLDAEKLASFTDGLSSQFAAIFEAISPTLTDEPSRLLAKGEYRAAVLAAFSLLESELNVALREDIAALGATRMPLRAMLDAASQILGPELQDRLLESLSIRNQVAHTYEPIRRDVATDVVRDVNEAIVKLRSFP